MKEPGEAGRTKKGNGLRTLTSTAGLPLSVTHDGRLHFGQDLEPTDPEVRRLSDMTGILHDPAADGPAEMYYMHRGVVRAQDAEAFASHDIRYDITVLVPGLVGIEYVKTAGHYHEPVPGADTRYPELYQVISGRACYILQRPGEDTGVVEAVVAVDAGPLDTVLVPPGWGHVTVNVSDEPLVMANLVERSFRSLYDEYRRRGGAAYYVLRASVGRAYLANRKYERVAPLRLVAAREWPHAGLGSPRPLYTSFVADPGRYEFLVRPHETAESWA